MGEHSAENDAWSYTPHEGPHEFKPWCVYPPDWWAPGCTCGVIRSAGKPTETEEAMRLWWETHAKEAGHTAPIPPARWDEEADGMFIDKAREAMRDIPPAVGDTTERGSRTFTNPDRTVVVTVHDAEGVAEIAFADETGRVLPPAHKLTEEI